MHFHLFSFGKVKTPGLKETVEYYLRLIRPWVALDFHELKPVPVTDKSPAGRHLIQKKEAELLKGRLSKTLSPRGAYYILDEGGKILSTQMWAKQIKEWQTEGVTEIVFCVGSSMGFDESIKSGARGIFSLGAQTLSHDLARAVLLEQLYRAMSVVRGHPYHNEG